MTQATEATVTNSQAGQSNDQATSDAMLEQAKIASQQAGKWLIDRNDSIGGKGGKFDKYRKFAKALLKDDDNKKPTIVELTDKIKTIASGVDDIIVKAAENVEIASRQKSKSCGGPRGLGSHQVADAWSGVGITYDQLMGG